VMTEVAEDRRQIVQLGDHAVAGMAKKRELLKAATEKVDIFHLFADLVVGAALANASRGERGIDAGAIEAAKLASDVASGADRELIERQAARWLATDKVAGSFDRQPLHWPLVFPEVFEHGGFDAVIGNPPFLGGSRITGPMGVAYREYLVEGIADGVRAGGRCDLVAYFLLRAHQLVKETGQTGLIATNTLAQGDTREVGLDRLVAGGVTIRRAVQSKPWPSRSAALEYCALWTSKVDLSPGAERRVDGAVVSRIESSLAPASRVSGAAKLLRANGGLSHIGTYIYGRGFLMDPREAQRLIEHDSRYAEVLLPYLGGQDVNSRPDVSASRWVIDFRDWDLAQAENYPACYEQVLRLVKPERDRVKRKIYRERWWQFAESQISMRRALNGLKRAIVLTLVSKTMMPVMVPVEGVFSHKLGVFSTDDAAMFAVLCSSPHYFWAMARTSTRGVGNAPNYSPSDVFETFPLPDFTDEARELGERLDQVRRGLMISRQSGLTATYNLVNDPSCNDADITELRGLHVAIDEAVCRAYRWDDLVGGRLGHGHHLLGRDIRYSVTPAVQREIVDRLLELNHQRYEEEVAKGLHEKKSGRKAKTTAEGLW